MSSFGRRGIVVIAALFLCLTLLLMARGAADAPATSDTAVIESYTLMASHGDLLVGAYSRFQWHHPGPLYFFLLAPFYAASGQRTTGLNAGAASISILSIAIVAIIVARRRPSLAVIVCAALALFGWRAAEATASPWNPHVPLLPLVALIVTASDVMAGHTAVLPLVGVLASLVGQAHVALMPTAIVLGGLAFARTAVDALTCAKRSVAGRPLVWTTLALGAAWALPLYEQLTGEPRGNVTELWQFFAHQAHAGQTFAVAVSAWSDMLVGILRPDFYVAHGWPYVESPVLWAEWLTLVLIVLLVGTVVRSARDGDRFTWTLGAVLLLSSGVALWSATRIEDRVFDHDVFWIAGVGILDLAVAADLVLSLVLKRTEWVRRETARVLCAVLVLSAVLASTLEVRRAVQRSFSPPAEAKIARALADDLDAYLRREHVARPLITIDQDAWGYVAGAILDLQKHGRLVSVPDDWVVMFTPVFRANGREDATIPVVMPPEHLRLAGRGLPVISAHDPVYAHVERTAH